MISVHGCPMVTPGMRSAGGMNVYLRRIAPLLAERGVCVDVFTRSHHAWGREVFDIGPHARVIHLPAGEPELTKAEVVPYLNDFRDRLFAFVDREGLGYDLVHSHYWLSGGVGDAVARVLKIPHVASFHTLAAVKERASLVPEPSERAETEARMAESADLVFAFTRDEAREFGELFGVPEDAVHIAPGGVDLSLFSPQDKAEARRRTGIDLDEKVILFVGRPEPFKGPDVLVRALAEMRNPTGVRLVLVGGSEDEHSVDWLRQEAEAAGVSENVRWQSAIPQTELTDFYAAADVCAVPSFHESFGLAALEAMACGTPVVAAAVGALPELVVHGETGFLVPGHLPELFAQCIEDLLNDPGRRERMGEAGVRHAAGYTWKQAADLALEGYQAVVGRSPRHDDVLPCG
jgi:D-inositol-3-phosphate glycosyltransferase